MSHIRIPPKKMNIMHTAVLVSGNIYDICLISVLWFFVKRSNKQNCMQNLFPFVV